MSEIWLPIPGFEGRYEVSDHGRVRSIAHTVPYRHRSGVLTRKRVRARILRPGTVKTGHQIVFLGCGNGRLIHRLVMEAFVGPRPPGKECCHWDGDPAHNHLTNLRWGTRTDNVRDAIRHGTHRGPAPSLLPGDIPEIRSMIARGFRDAEIGAGFGVTRSTIQSIRRGRTWGRIQEVAA